MFCLHVCLCNLCMQYPWSPGEGVRDPGTEVSNGCYPPRACWEPNPVLAEPVFLIINSSL